MDIQISGEIVNHQKTESLRPTIFIPSLIFFSFSSTTNWHMALRKGEKQMMRYSGTIDLIVYSVSDVKEGFGSSCRLTEGGTWLGDHF